MGRLGTVTRVARYTGVRFLSLIFSTVVGVYLLIIIANFGGYIDQIMEGRIYDARLGYEMANVDLSREERDAEWAQIEAALRLQYGLDTPFLVRCARWAWNGLSLQWGETERLSMINGDSDQVVDLIMERLPNTLLLAGTANLLVFVVSLYGALFFSRRRSKFIDRMIIALSPISSAPSWIHGIILLGLFAVQVQLLPYGGMYIQLPDDTFMDVLRGWTRHLALPVTAILFSIFFQNLYAWRTFFVVQSGEDYVELAKAKGLPGRMIDRKYILRPNLPTVLTSFALMVMGFWQGAIALEILFDWPGIGSLYWDAITRVDRPVVVGLIVLFAYLFSATVFLLDLLYVLVDPRVQVVTKRSGGVHRKPWWRRRFWRRSRKSSPRRLPKKSESYTRNREPSPHAADELATPRLSAWVYTWRYQILPVVNELIKFPMAVVGLLLIVFLVIISTYTVIELPYQETSKRWRSTEWIRNPRQARPVWFNWFRTTDLPETIVLDTRSSVGKEWQDVGAGMLEVVSVFEFDYSYQYFPQDVTVNFYSEFEEKRPFISLTWVKPDGTEIRMGEFSVGGVDSVVFEQEDAFNRALGEFDRMEILFGDGAENAIDAVVVPGTYQLQVAGLVFEPESDVDFEMMVYGQVHGWAGTDHRRRDLGLALLWGMPIALLIGVVGAISTATLSLLLAALGAWRGGWIDAVIQRVTEINIIMPALPLALIVYYVYSKSILPVLGVLVVTRIFGASLKIYRAMLLQIKEAPYIEGAQSYGASDWRIVRKYLIPRIALVVVPDVISLVPTFVFLETTLAFLGIADPYIPTWGKVIFDAISNGGLRGNYYWVLEPVGLVLLTGLAFALVGYALDDILNPRLRDL